MRKALVPVPHSLSGEAFYTGARLGSAHRSQASAQARLSKTNEVKMSTTDDHHSCLNGNSSALEQAKGIQANSSGQFPSFLKQLLKSHLSGKFYLGLPKKFCDAHMPSHDDTIVLVDENEQEYNTKYSVRKNRLSGGWRGFSIAHKLLEGDALVYIVRAGNLTEKNNGAIGFHTCGFQDIKPISSARRIHLNSLAVNNHHQETKKARLISDSKLDTGQSENDIDHFDRNVLEDNRYSESVVYFKDVKSFEDFKIQADGLILDSEIPTNLRTKYYHLCCSQKRFLHDCLIKGLSSKLAVVMISETVNIADAIKSAELATSLHHFECWEKTLKAFEDLGMAVGFLRDRLQKLVGISREYCSTVETQRNKKELKSDEQMSNLEATSLNVKTLIGSLEAEVEALKWKNKKLGFEFQMLAQAPW
ncbi:hypothetical protein DH2020_029395 [Rehmannia glutinosa]|uniref:TF-B3 domain-containing protein n=1 Tax=Rehmannia glutinosa TaxID=99300 RepID=A0ABR0VNM8_REHGL